VNFEVGSSLAFARTCRLGDLLDFRNDIVHPKDKPSGGSIFVGLEHVERDTGIRIGAERIDLSKLTGRRARFRAGDIVYGYLRPYLNKVWIAEFDGICSVDQYVFVARPQVDRNYIARFLRSAEFLKTAPIDSTPGQLPRIRSGEIAKTPISLPPLAEQRRIAAMLDKADELRRKRMRMLDLLAELARSFADKCLFSERAIELGELIAEGPTNGLYKPSSVYGDGVPILRINNFYDGEIVDISALKRLRITDVELSRFRLSVGDIVINRVNSLEYLGKSALVKALTEPTVYESNMMRFSIEKSVMLPEVCIALLQTHHTREQILSRAKNAVNQSSINQTDVRALSLPIPAMVDQKRFVAALKLNETFRSNVLNTHRKAEELFLSLQHRAFSGQL